MKTLGVVAVIISLASASCSTEDLWTKKTAGAVLGGGTGALVGSQIGGGKGKLIAVAVGTLAGAVIGSEIGSSLDKADKLAMESNARNTLERSATNTTSTWQNPDNGNAGSLTPTRTFKNDAGQDCREYLQTVRIAGEEHEAHGTACRESTGDWRIVQ